jgi:hypothetical protein
MPDRSWYFVRTGPSENGLGAIRDEILAAIHLPEAQGNDEMRTRIMNYLRTSRYYNYNIYHCFWLSKRLYDNQNFIRILGLITEAELNNRKGNISKEFRRNETEKRNIVAEVSFQLRSLDVNDTAKSYGKENATIPLAEIGRWLFAYDFQVE